MATRRSTFAKREREQKLKEKAQAKKERRAAKRAGGGQDPLAPDGSDDASGLAPESTAASAPTPGGTPGPAPAPMPASPPASIDSGDRPVAQPPQRRDE